MWPWYKVEKSIGAEDSAILAATSPITGIGMRPAVPIEDAPCAVLVAADMRAWNRNLAETARNVEHISRKSKPRETPRYFGIKASTVFDRDPKMPRPRR